MYVYVGVYIEKRLEYYFWLVTLGLPSIFIISDFSKFLQQT